MHAVVRQCWAHVGDRYKNYIDFPKANGYRSLHDTVRHESNMLLEVQIRTAQMHHENEHGAASHSFYKAGILTPKDAQEFAASDMHRHALPGQAASTEADRVADG